MAKQIVLSLKIDGVQQNISTIGQLEDSVKSLQNQLKGVEIGSDEFKKLTTEINNAQSVLKDFNKSIEGQELEQRVGAFAKVGEGITASFAGAQAALSLFGAESESVSKAAAQAQNLLTIALAARSAAEGLVQIRTVASIVATKAQTLATNAASTATRAFYTVLAANPYGAILAAIGLVVGALVALSNKQKEIVNTTKELTKATSDEATTLKNQLRILTQTTGLRSLQEKTIKDLVKQYPGFNSLIDKENKLTEAGVRFLNLKIKQLELEAQARLVVNKIAENSIRIQELEFTNITENLTLWDKFVVGLRTGASVYSGVAESIERGAKRQREAIKEITDENEKWRKELLNIETGLDEVYKGLVPYENILQETTKETKEASSSTKELKETYEDTLRPIKSFAGELKKLSGIIGDYNREIAFLEKIQFNTKVVEDLRKIQEARKDAASNLISQIELTQNALKELAPRNILPEDTFFQLFTNYTQELKNVFGVVDFNYREFAQTVIDQNGIINKQQQDSIKEIAIAYESLQDILQQIPESGFDAFNQLFDLDLLRENSREYVRLLEDNLFFPLAEEALLTKRKVQENLLLTVTDPKIKKQIQDSITQINVEIARLYSEQPLTGIIDEDAIRREVRGVIDEIINFSSKITEVEDRVKVVNDEVQRLTQNLTTNTLELRRAIQSTLLDNIDTIFQVLSPIKTRAELELIEFREQLNIQDSEVQDFKNRLVKAGFDIESQSIEDLYIVYTEFKRKEKEAFDEVEQYKREETQKTYDDISLGLALFADTLAEISRLVQASIEADIEGLRVKEQLLLNQIVGDSENANKKRLEITAEYEKKRLILEKQARIKSLQFSQAQAIANGAQAIVRALADLGPIVGAIVGAVIAGTTATQVSIIQTQLQNARALRRGGLLSGPSHEEGGIYYAQQGVVVEGQESVINRNSTLNYRDLLSQINQAGGGAPLVVNNFDSSSIVEAIAQQNKQPIRAYVLESEITNQQGISRRLEELSKF